MPDETPLRRAYGHVELEVTDDRPADSVRTELREAIMTGKVQPTIEIQDIYTLTVRDIDTGDEWTVDGIVEWFEEHGTNMVVTRSRDGELGLIPHTTIIDEQPVSLDHSQ